MNTTRIVLAALVIFAAGVLTGTVGAGLAGRILRQRPQSGDLSSPVTVPAAGASNRSAGVLAKPPGNAQLEAMAGAHLLAHDGFKVAVARLVAGPHGETYFAGLGASRQQRYDSQPRSTHTESITGAPRNTRLRAAATAASPLCW